MQLWIASIPTDAVRIKTTGFGFATQRKIGLWWALKHAFSIRMEKAV
jgi:hypothetical protein